MQPQGDRNDCGHKTATQTVRAGKAKTAMKATKKGEHNVVMMMTQQCQGGYSGGKVIDYQLVILSILLS
jgi:hypothetical protein